MSDGPISAERFLELVGAMQSRQPSLTTIQAALLVAAEHGIANDSRSLANRLDIAHALVLRELNPLIDTGQLVLTKRDARTLRTHYALPPSGEE